MVSFRKHCGWYVKGFRSAKGLQQQLLHITNYAALVEILATVDRNEPFPLNQLRNPRGKRRGKQRVSLPAGYLDDLEDATPPGGRAEDPASGG